MLPYDDLSYVVLYSASKLDNLKGFPHNTSPTDNRSIKKELSVKFYEALKLSTS
jgi:hypothetical protein